MTRIKKEEFDNLPESLKAKFKADGDEYVLIEEDVSGLKQKADELLKEKKALEKAFEGIDPEKAKEALANATAAEDERLKAAGEFEILRGKLEERHANELAKASEQTNSILAKLRQERIANLAISKGVKADRIKAALAEGDLDSILELDAETFNIKKVGGIGDAKEIDEIFTTLKTEKPYLFDAGNTEGGGAAGSSNNNGDAKTMPHSEYKKLSAKDQAAFVKSGGKPVE